MGAPYNPPAFPLAVEPGFQFANDGMTMRDWFAGQALAVIDADKASAVAEKLGRETPQVIASLAYAIANAMLAERAKGQPK
jgi:hypothetical protein